MTMSMAMFIVPVRVVSMRVVSVGIMAVGIMTVRGVAVIVCGMLMFVVGVIGHLF
jgi:hypothetical protein